MKILNGKFYLFHSSMLQWIKLLKSACPFLLSVAHKKAFFSVIATEKLSYEPNGLKKKKKRLQLHNIKSYP